MGSIRSHRPVMVFLAATSRLPAALDWARRRCEQRFGKPAVAGAPFDFVQTTYYQAEMGTQLKKVWWTFEPLIDPAGLADIKRETNQWEVDFQQQYDGPESRILNLDPGYLTEAKLVLATTKDRDHRVYLRDGIFAEVTLYYHAGRWHARPWTYPDYQLPACLQFLDDSRRRLRQRLRQPDE